MLPALPLHMAHYEEDIDSKTAISVLTVFVVRFVCVQTHGRAEWRGGQHWRLGRFLFFDPHQVGPWVLQTDIQYINIQIVYNQHQTFLSNDISQLKLITFPVTFV